MITIINMNEDPKFLVNNPPTILEFLFSLLAIIFITIFLVGSLPSMFSYKNSSTILVDFIIVGVILIASINVLFNFIRVSFFMLFERQNPYATKVSAIKKKFQRRSKSSNYFYLVDKERTKYTVTPEIYDYFHEGDSVIINYYYISKYMHSIAKDEGSSYIQKQNDELIKYT